VQIGTICPLDIVQKVKRLMYTYRHINAIELEHILLTNLYIYRVRLKPRIVV
jgi:hypothetical protein